MKKFSFLILIFLISLLLAGCAAFTPPTPLPTTLPSSSPTPIPPTRTATATNSPTATLTPLPSLTPTITLTRTPNLGADFKSAKLVQQGFLPFYNYFFALQMDQEPIGEYYAMVDANKLYKCEKVAKYPNRLFCSGPLAAAADYVDYQLFLKGMNIPLVTGRFLVPAPEIN